MPLARYLGQRVLQALVIIFGILVFNFVLIHAAPGDVADVLAGESGAADASYVEELRTRFGLDRPLYEQFGLYVANAAHFDLGFSFRNNVPVIDLIASRLPATLLLMGASIVLATGGGVILGLAAARRAGGVTDNAISIVVLIAYATPLFWIGLMLIVLFAVKLGWLPSGGFDTIGAGLTGFARVRDIGAHLVLPTITLGLFYLGIYTRLVRASVLEVAGLDFVRTARAKGVEEGRILRAHVLRNALLPLVTMVGMQVASLLGGAVLVETVFAWPGLGRLTFEAVTQRDVNLLLGLLLLSSAMVVTVNLLIDLLYALLDPRIRLA